MLFIALTVIIASCGIDAEPGPADTEQAPYVEPETFNCAELDGRSYAITFATGGAATDTLVFAENKFEAVQRIAMGYPASAYACSERNDALLITSEMLTDSASLLRWDLEVTEDGVKGSVIAGDAGAGCNVQKPPTRCGSSWHFRRNLYDELVPGP